MDPQQVFGSLLVAAVVGLVTAVIKLWQKHSTLELKVAENYLKKDALDEVKDDVREIRELVHRLCMKLEVPVFTEPYHR